MNKDPQFNSLFEALGAPTASAGRSVMFVSACSGEGTSHLARSFAEQCAWRGARATLLVDLDPARDGQHAALVAQGAKLGAPSDGRLAGASLFVVTDSLGVERATDRTSFTLSRVGDRRLYVTRCAAAAGQTLSVPPRPDYWNAARLGAEYCVVDAPSHARSQDALTVAPFMDGIVLVVSGLRGAAQATLALKAELEARNARVLGLLYADADRGVTLIERWLRRAA